MHVQSRRQILRNLSLLSAANAFRFPALGLHTMLQSPASNISNPDKNDLYILLTGSWVMSFDQANQKLLAISTHNDGHTYDYSVPLDPKSKPEAIGKDKTYHLDVTGHTANDSQTLIGEMRDAGLGFLFKNVELADLSTRRDLRRIELPIPTYVRAAAIVYGITINISPAISQIQQPIGLPSALVLIYSGAAWNATVTSPASGKRSFQRSGSSTHIRFRVCPSLSCGHLPTRTRCSDVSPVEAHNREVFKDMLKLLKFPPGTPMPNITFPACLQGNPNDDTQLYVDRGPDQNLADWEVGLPAKPSPASIAAPPNLSPQPLSQGSEANIFFGNLHNCAASGMVVGS